MIHNMLRMLALLLLALVATASMATTSNETPPVSSTAAPLEIFNRTIITFRTSTLGMTPEMRAGRAKASISEILREGTDTAVSIKPNPEGHLVMIGDRLAFIVAVGDAEPGIEGGHAATAKAAAAQLERVISETREARSVQFLLKAGMQAALATLVFFLLLYALARIRRWLQFRLVKRAARKADDLKLGETQLVERRHLITMIQRVLNVLRWLIVALLVYEWLSFLLSTFPYTRPWGESLNDYLVQVITGVFKAVIGALPGLGVAAVIFLLARFSVGFLGGMLERISKTESAWSWLGPDTMPTTRRLFNIGIWLFAVAMAYPYLPGAQTEAFKGISVLVGLMVSLGASSIVGQGAAGLILTYTRTMKVGEYVRIGEHEGTVTRIGTFTTTIRTGLGEELTLPNSVITGGVTKNYSRAVHGPGFIVDTVVTIGYDTPWRQVEAMLVEAARRTPGILGTPTPRVFQTALSDYYPEYRLVAQAVPSEPKPRAEVMTMLHANIQDVFNEYGVQIMSPHYMMDPANEKVVKRDDWYKAPARPPKG